MTSLSTPTPLIAAAGPYAAGEKTSGGQIRDLTSGMNDSQRQAVQHPGGPLLIVAGAGSGKTRVLTHRIAYLSTTQAIEPYRFLAITFTNRAAREMRRRLAPLTDSADKAWVMTFHAACGRILRANAALTPYTSSFTVHDQAASTRMIKRLVTALDDEHGLTPKDVQTVISLAKNHMLTYDSEHPELTPEIARIWRAYDAEMRRTNAMDFDDLLLNTIALLREHPDVQAHYHRRFAHILVDEYQDTNTAQVEILALLAGPQRNITAVGDPDQAIYHFRGADIANILEFEQRFPGRTLIKLEQNYRSTQRILDTANSVIAQNPNRIEKNLWTAQAGGDPILVDRFLDQYEEARHVANIARAHVTAGNKLSDIAVLYRTNAQSKPLEDSLRGLGLPYQLIGGTRFYDRKTVKDALAYLTIAINPRDDSALTRIINTPARRIGPGTVNAARMTAAAGGISIWEAIATAPDAISIPTRERNYVLEFRDLWAPMLELAADTDLSGELLKTICDHVGLMPPGDNKTTAAAEQREQLHDLFADIDRYVEHHGPDSTIQHYLEYVALSTAEDNADTAEIGAITLMTAHASKGLEYPIVFVTGLEETVFPHARATIAGEIEEERRLFYVAVTRAMRELHLTYATERRLWGDRPVSAGVSRFLTEIPEDLYTQTEHGASDLTFSRLFNPDSLPSILRPQIKENTKPPTEALSIPTAAGGFSINQRVSHPQYGTGTIVAIDGPVINVAFDTKPSKPLEILSITNVLRAV